MMNDYHENHLPNYPKFYMWQLQDNINDYDTGGFMKFKLYGNSKSRPVGNITINLIKIMNSISVLEK